MKLTQTLLEWTLTSALLILVITVLRALLGKRVGAGLRYALWAVALAVHWWNPLVWLAVVLSRRDCELACDEGTLRRLGDGERIAYGRTLLTLLTERPRAMDLLSCATTMTGGQKNVFDRVTRIARAPKRWLWATVAAVLITVLACACAFSAKEKAPEEEPDPAEPSSAGIDLGKIPADLSFSLDQQEKDDPFVRINGTVDGEDLPRRAMVSLTSKAGVSNSIYYKEAAGHTSGGLLYIVLHPSGGVRMPLSPRRGQKASQRGRHRQSGFGAALGAFLCLRYFCPDSQSLDITGNLCYTEQNKRYKRGIWP